MGLFDIWEQASNTELVQATAQTQLEQLDRPAAQLATLVPTSHDKISLSTGAVKAFGMARFKAFGASSPIYVPRVSYSESEIELVQISEQSPIDEIQMRLLEDDDPKIRARAGADYILRAAALQVRNERRSDWMVMTALKTGILPVSFEDRAGQGLVVDYDFLPSNKCTVVTPWSNLANSTPIDDIRAWQLQLANSCGEYGRHIWMNSTTWNKVLYSAQAAALLTGSDRGQRIATVEDIRARLFDPEQVTLHITDAGYRDANAGYNRGLSAHTKWFADNEVLMTASNPFNGRPICEQFDGRVLVRTDYKTRELRQGAQTYVKLDDSDTLSVYQTSTRMPRVNAPEAVLTANTSGQ